MKVKKKIVFRADGNSGLGLGHIARCCALADMLKDNFHCCFYIRATSKTIIDNIQNYCTSVTEINDTVSFDEESETWVNILEGDEIIVLDGYNFDTGYQLKIKSKGCKLVCIDDMHPYHFVADVIINHSPNILCTQYSCEPYTQLFLGPGYVLLKKIFLQKAALQNKVLDFDNSPLLVCMGGADPGNKTVEIVKEVRQLFPGKKILVIVGSAYKFKDTLQAICKTSDNISVFTSISSEELIALMEKAHIAVTSASTVALEYLCIRGNLFLIHTAGNQSHLYMALIEKKCAWPYAFLFDHYNSSDTIHNQHALIDGKSDERILKIFADL
jgi:UDP-2,4-diacetamido-2,4,6-trideoxy-beta-L-altropyranose hydrolase